MGTIAELLQEVINQKEDLAGNLTAMGVEAESTETLNSLVPKVLDIATEGGKSAYEIAVENGFTGTEAEWLASLKGEDGDNGSDGKSAYEIAVQDGFIGTEEEWVASLKGEDGHKIVSVTELPENPEPNTWYAIREEI